MIRRILVLWFTALVVTGCTPPCRKAARAICDIQAEGDACSFLLEQARDDLAAQLTCQGILPAAQALGEDPHSATAINAWEAARERLVQAGLHPDENHGKIDQKLIRANGVAGHLVQHAEDNMKADEQHTNDSAQKALEGESK